MGTALQHPSGDPVEDPAARFASELRALRNSAGSPTYRQMAARTGQSPGALSHAAKGRQLPTLDVALAYAEACDGDRAEWERRWRTAKAELDTAPTPRRRWTVAAVAVTVTLTLAVAGVVLLRWRAPESPPSDAADHTPRFFADDDPFNQRHPRPRLSSDSERMVAGLLGLGQVTVHTRKAGIPVYRAASSTPTYDVTARRHVGQWGPNPFEGIDFPWDASWKEHPDLQWSVVITPGGRSLECWRIQLQDGVPSCEWGAVADTLDSSVSTEGRASGSGLSRLAGLITRDEWKAGRIDHALSFGTPFNNDQHVFPATRSDGKSQDHWRQGQFIWLDREYDIDADTSLKPYERMVAKALQEYGAFNVKNSKTFSFESEYGAKPPGSGGGPYTPLTNIKFAKYLRVGTIAPPW